MEQVTDISSDNETTQGFTFTHLYRSYTLSTTSTTHCGNKIKMPASALETLLQQKIQYPMQFQISNELTGRLSHCGVLEFTADEGCVFLPFWMMENMKLLEGDLVRITNVKLVRGTYLKLQPHSTNFVKISDPKTVLEETLKSFSCLTIGDTITIKHDKKDYRVDIVESKPCPAISIIDTDCEVDFATPLDYKEFKEAAPKVKPKDTLQSGSDEKKRKFEPFTGVGRRLDGTKTAEATATDVSVLLPSSQAATLPSNSASGKRGRQLIFGSSGIGRPNKIAKPSEGDDKFDKQEKKFQPFTGKKYTLI